MLLAVVIYLPIYFECSYLFPRTLHIELNVDIWPKNLPLVVSFFKITKVSKFQPKFALLLLSK